MRILLTSSAAAVAEAKRLGPDAVVLDLDAKFNRVVDALMPDASEPPSSATRPTPRDET